MSTIANYFAEIAENAPRMNPKGSVSLTLKDEQTLG